MLKTASGSPSGTITASKTKFSIEINYSSCWTWWYMCLGGRGRCIFESLRPAWSIKLVLGQPDLWDSVSLYSPGSLCRPGWPSSASWVLRLKSPVKVCDLCCHSRSCWCLWCVLLLESMLMSEISAWSPWSLQPWARAILLLWNQWLQTHNWEWETWRLLG